MSHMVKKNYQFPIFAPQQLNYVQTITSSDSFLV